MQYVDGGDASYTASAIRSSTYPYPEMPLYTETASNSYYEAVDMATQGSIPATSQAMDSSISVPMYTSSSQVVTSPIISRSAASKSSNGSGGGRGGRQQLQWQKSRHLP